MSTVLSVQPERMKVPCRLIMDSMSNLLEANDDLQPSRSQDAQEGAEQKEVNK